jgi:hypothetical protein
MIRPLPDLRWRDLQKFNSIGFRLRCLIYLGAAALFCEKCLPPFLAVMATVLVFFTVSLFGLWEVVNGWLHILLLIPFFFGLTASLIWMLRVANMPAVSESIQRLEKRNQISHQRLRALFDSPAGLPKVSDSTQLLWNEHVTRAAGTVKTLKAVWPSAQMARRDPFGLALTLAAFVLLAFLVAGEQTSARLAAVRDVHLSVFEPLEPGELTAWINPPKYTGLPPVFLADRKGSFVSLGTGGKVVVAEGSTFVARVYGGEAVPFLRGQEAFEAVQEMFPLEREFEVVDANNYSIEHELFSGGLLHIDQGLYAHGSWGVEVLPDEIPSVSLISPPEKTARGSLKLTYRAEDDYGIEGIFAQIQFSNIEFSTIGLALDIPSGSPQLFEEIGFYDLASHPWAGFPATISLIARDAAGGEGKSESIEFELPRREFRHPLAQSLIEYRRQFAWRLADASEIKLALEELYEVPDEVQAHGFVLEGLRAATKRLGYSDDEKSRSDIMELLWEVAIHVEDGAVLDFEKRLWEAQAALRSALDQNASNEEILALSQNLRDALGDFLQTLDGVTGITSPGSLVDIKRDLFGAEGESSPSRDDFAMPETGTPVERPEGEMSGAQELQDMAQAIEDLALTGSREAAQNVLDQLQETLENLGAGQMSEGGAGGDNASDEEEMASLEDIMERQDALLNETFRQMSDDPSDISDLAPTESEQETGRMDEGAMAEGTEAGQNPPGLRDDQIERMDDLSGGDPSPTAARQSNSVQQTQNPQMPEQNAGAGTQTSGEGEQGDMPGAMTSPGLSNQADEETGEDQEALTSPQNTAGSSSADGDGPEQGRNQISSGASRQSPRKQPLARQERIREELSDLIRSEGVAQERIPVQLEKAEKHMRDASEALRRERPDRAVRAQTQALHQLKQGVSLLHGPKSGEPGAGATELGAGQQRADTERDPFGRKSQEILGSPTGFVEIPEMSEVQQSRRILAELYRRAGQSERSEQERDYIERLLQWY